MHSALSRFLPIHNSCNYFPNCSRIHVITYANLRMQTFPIEMGDPISRSDSNVRFCCISIKTIHVYIVCQTDQKDIWRFGDFLKSTYNITVERR